MHLSPSDIHFLKDYLTDFLTPDESLLTTLSDRFLSANELPKIQVVERNGAWFALNNTSLHVFRALQRQGKCVRIQVDVVPLSKVPKSVQESMVVELTTDHLKTTTTTADDESNKTVSLKHIAGCDNDLKKVVVSRNLSQNQFDDDDDEAAEEEDDDEKFNSNFQVENCENCTQNEGSSGKATKRGYHKLSDVWNEDSSSNVPNQDSETEGTSTDYSDYDHEVEEGGDEESDTDYDESLTCNVCDRSFTSSRQLAEHQQRKRHFGCSVCDSIFPNLTTLELHKESLEHWSDDEDDDDNVQGGSGGGGGRGGKHSVDESDEDDDDDDVRSPTEELERLL